MAIIENVSFTEQYFDLVIDKLLSLLFSRNTELKIENIFRKFCNLLNVEKTFVSVCQQLLVYKDARFIEQIVHIYSLDKEAGSGTLLEFCKLVNLLESPNFTCNYDRDLDLRVQLMEKSRYPFLTECIYSLLMIIPQGRIFESLKNRVDVLNHVDVLEQRPRKNYRRDLDAYLGEFQRTLRLLPP
ncbi:unnamed protein product [Sphagnum jensenii]